MSPGPVILDLFGNEGLKAARELRRLFPSLPLVIFMSFPTVHLKREAMDAGVSSLFSKCPKPNLHDSAVARSR